jgi:ArsR family transcriptional regulator, arsenate/arsenite/antimonite-responsive transcriptional repressor
MVYAKTQLFEEELQNSAELFKALAHPARLAILKYLAGTKTCITGDFADELPLSRTTVNQHLKELKDAGLIVGTIEGVKTCYCLNHLKIKELQCLIDVFFGEIITMETDSCK